MLSYVGLLSVFKYHDCNSKKTVSSVIIPSVQTVIPKLCTKKNMKSEHILPVPPQFCIYNRQS